MVAMQLLVYVINQQYNNHYQVVEERWVCKHSLYACAIMGLDKNNSTDYSVQTWSQNFGTMLLFLCMPEQIRQNYIQDLNNFQVYVFSLLESRRYAEWESYNSNKITR